MEKHFYGFIIRVPLLIYIQENHFNKKDSLHDFENRKSENKVFRSFGKCVNMDRSSFRVWNSMFSTEPDVLVYQIFS
ncbi:hypothetical protein DMI72_07885 [Akkermansia muciniphila]|nr:hypothetical protein DMI72_07885 [Akkermansia muciniphila]